MSLQKYWKNFQNLFKLQRDFAHFQRNVKRLLRLLQIMAVAPILVEERKKSIFGLQASLLHRLWCILVLFTLYTFCYIECAYYSIYMNSMLLATVFELAGFFVECLLITVAAFNCYQYKEEYYIIPAQLKKLYETAQNYTETMKLNVPQYFINIYNLCLVVLIFAIINMVLRLPFSGLTFSWVIFRRDITYVLPNVLIIGILAQFWLPMRCICLIYRCFNRVLANFTANKELVHIKSLGAQQEKWLVATAKWYEREFLSSRATHQSWDSELEVLRDLYLELDDLICRLENAFGPVLVLNFILVFLKLSLNIFGVYDVFDDSIRSAVGLNGLNICYNVLWVLLSIFLALLVLIVINDIKQERCITCFLLNLLDINSSGREHTINRFLGQFIHNKSLVSACGLLDLDLSLLLGLLNASAIFIMFFIQVSLANNAGSHSARN